MPDYASSPTLWALLGGSCLATVILTPLVMALAHGLGAVDRGGHRKVHQGRPIPRIGGLAIALPFVGACLFCAFSTTGMSAKLENMTQPLVALAMGCAAIVMLGMADDTFGLGARAKLLGQVVIALFMCAMWGGIRQIELPAVGLIEVPFPAGELITVLWIVGLTNAYNLIDGIDGLASGLALIGGIGLAVIAASGGGTFAVLLCASLVGSLAGFLIYNFNPARIFLGDTGSMFLGFTLANITLMGSLKSPAATILVAPILVLALPVMDTLTSMLRRYLRGRPIFAGDQGHMHHRLLRMGLSPRQAAVTLYGFSAALAVTAISAFEAPTNSPLFWLSCAAYGVVMVSLVWRTGYLTPTSWRLLRQGRQRNTLLNAFAKYTASKLSLSGDTPDSGTEYILWLICQEMCLRRLRVETEDGAELLNYGMTADTESDGPALHRFRALNRSGQMLEIKYEPNGLPEGLEPHDVEACLARILEETDLHLVRTVGSIAFSPVKITISGEHAA